MECDQPSYIVHGVATKATAMSRTDQKTKVGICSLIVLLPETPSSASSSFVRKWGMWYQISLETYNFNRPSRR
jgi:hypothetical protein